MNNQAAQTMPAVEAAVNAGLASYHGVKTFSSEVRLRSALEATARAMLAAAPAASAKYCSDERPCTPCFSNNGPCEDAPAASGGEVWTREMIADVHKRGEELFQRINPRSLVPTHTISPPPSSTQLMSPTSAMPNLKTLSL